MTRARTVTVLTASLATLLLSAAPAHAQQIYVLELEGIPGDSAIELLDGKGIAVVSFAWGVTNAATVGTKGLTTGKATISDFTVTLAGGREVPDLFVGTASGRRIPSAKFVVLENTGDGLSPRYEVKFTNVFLTAFQSAGSVGDRLFHSLSMAFETVTINVYTQASDGTVKTLTGAWSIIKNQ